jgi:HD-like signal output (HDOD) protein
MKARKLLTAVELQERREYLARQLDSIGFESQPQIAIKILELNARPDAQLKDYAAVVKTDPSLSGRLLKLANSAMFAQRKPVTSIDRACLLLGLERLKAISLGFQLGRAAAAAGQSELSRKVWGQNVFRACVAAECAKLIAPTLTSEAFVVGLMMDAGIPLMGKLLGASYYDLYNSCSSPATLYLAEFDSLPFTHVDVMHAMALRWRLPDLLTQPITWHHTKPADTRRAEPPHRLHRISFGVGIVCVPYTASDSTDAKPSRETGLGTLQQLLAISRDDAQSILTRAVTEYDASSEMFSDIAQSLGNVDSLAERVHLELVEAFDALTVASLTFEDRDAPQCFAFGSQRIEISLDESRAGVACLLDSGGNPIVTYRFNPNAITIPELFDSLGIEDAPHNTKPLEDYLRRLAA